jgi:hypothetical protein
MTPPIAVADFQAYYDRDFVFGTQMNTVRTQDMQNAINRANMLFNPGLWDSAADAITAFQPLTAHCLVKALEAGGGLEREGAGVKSTGSGIVLSKNAGPMSVNYALPESLINNPICSDLMTTGYGKMYLQLVVPRLLGNVRVVRSDVNP